MQKLGLLTLSSQPMLRSVADVELGDQNRNAPTSDPGRQQLRKNGLLTYESDVPYRIGYDVILSRWGKVGIGPVGRVRLRKNGLLTLS